MIPEEVVQSVQEVEVEDILDVHVGEGELQVKCVELLDEEHLAWEVHAEVPLWEYLQKTAKKHTEDRG